MALVRQLDRRSGITYVYESHSYWDREKKQPRSKRTLIRRLDPETGEIRPTDGRGKRRAAESATAAELQSAADISSPAAQSSAAPSRRLLRDAADLLDRVGEALGVSADLKACFPGRDALLLSVVFYLVMEDREPLRRFGKWAAFHRHPFGAELSPARLSELFSSVTADAASRFFRLRRERGADEPVSVYALSVFPSSSVSASVSCPEPLRLALAFGEASCLPFACGCFTGGVPDASAVRELFGDGDLPGAGGKKPLLNLGFLRPEELEPLLKKRRRFLCETALSFGPAKDLLREAVKGKTSGRPVGGGADLYISSVSFSADASQDRARKGDAGREERRIFLHLYFSPDRFADEKRMLERRLEALKKELRSGNRFAEHEKEYKRYFEIKKSSGKESAVSVKEDAVRSALDRLGYFVLVGSAAGDPAGALALARSRAYAENVFRGVFERLRPRTADSPAGPNAEAVLFAQFLALIFLSHIRKRTEESRYSALSAQELLDRLDVIEGAAEQGNAPDAAGEREQIWRALGSAPPSAS